MEIQVKAKLPILLLSLTLAFGCKEPVEPEPTLDISNGILILNEGNFQGGNASLDFFPHSGTPQRDVYSTATSLPLGDVAQSLILHGGDLFITVNNSGRIHRLNLPDLKPICTLAGLSSPRHLLPISSTKAYATDLYSRSITILDPSTCTRTGEIPTGGWTEELLLLDGKCYVAQTGTDKVLVIDPATDQLLDSIPVGRAPVSLRPDALGRLWILCDGGLGPEPAQLSLLDPSADTLLRTLTFPSPSAFPADLRTDPTAQQLLWLDGGLWRMSIHDTALPTTPILPANGRNFYMLDIDPAQGRILLGDAKDFVQQGELLILDANGMELERHAVGVNPGAAMGL